MDTKNTIDDWDLDPIDTEQDNNNTEVSVVEEQPSEVAEVKEDGWGISEVTGTNTEEVTTTFNAIDKSEEEEKVDQTEMELIKKDDKIQKQKEEIETLNKDYKDMAKSMADIAKAQTDVMRMNAESNAKLQEGVNKTLESNAKMVDSISNMIDTKTKQMEAQNQQVLDATETVLIEAREIKEEDEKVEKSNKIHRIIQIGIIVALLLLILTPNPIKNFIQEKAEGVYRSWKSDNTPDIEEQMPDVDTKIPSELLEGVGE